MSKNFKIALCQTMVKDDKDYNLKKALEFIEEAAINGANIISLGEMFICPYRNDAFIEYAEEEERSQTLKSISEMARKHSVYVVAGSIPEKEEDRYYNTSYVIGKEGNVITKHRKIHLFDIDIKDGVYMKESDTFSYGEDITIFDTEYCKVGLAICYDMRFPEIFRIMVQNDVKLVIVPAAFNNITGPAHWDIIIRNRAVDNQIYFAAASPARNYDETYLAYGHSSVCSPFGEIIGQLSENEDILYSDIDLEYLDKVREQLPLLKHRRLDLYQVKSKI